MKAFLLACGALMVASLFMLSVGLLLFSCFQAAGQPFPTSQQMMTACHAEIAKGIPAQFAPDCAAHYAIQMACNAEALGPAINPLVTMVNPVAGSVLTVQATLNKQLCQQQGFYDHG